MLAARFRGSDRSLTLEDVPVPEPGPLDVLVRVEACGICLSDVHLIDGSIPPVVDVVTPGHESCGVIERAGDLVDPSWVGRRVVVMGGRPCTRCDACLVGDFESCSRFELLGFHYDGAWAEYVCIPHYTVVPVPDGIPVEQAAILADAVATPYGALADRANLRAGESVGLWGIGGLGTHAVQIARLLGAAPIVAVDPLESARARAEALGADLILDPSQDVKSEVMSLTGGQGLDVVLDLVGSNAVLSQAVPCMGRGGRALIVGITLDPLQLGPSILLSVQRQTIMGHLGYRKEHLQDLVRLVEYGRLDLVGSISDVMPLEKVEDGVRRLAEKDGDPVRLIVKPLTPD